MIKRVDTKMEKSFNTVTSGINVFHWWIYQKFVAETIIGKFSNQQSSFKEVTVS